MSARSASPLSPFAVGVAVLSSIGCIYWTQFRMLPWGDLPIFQKFYVNLLTALAFAEMVMLIGTFVGPGPQGPWPFAVAAWVLMFGFILPKLVRYWRRKESTL